ncbi:MAG: hypothetical protein Q9214_000636 [Letrouitia sp. 1 TL-2023]
MSSSSTNSSPQLSPTFYVPQLYPAPHSKHRPPFSAEQLPYAYSTADYYIHSNPSTPSYDQFYSLSLSDSQYMTKSPSQNPPIRVQHSTPNYHHELPSPLFNIPPSRLDGDDFAGNSWDNHEHASHLSPHALQQLSSSARRFPTHKRLSSDSSVGSVGLNSPYTQTLAYPHIVDTESSSVASPQFDYYDAGFSASGNYSKPLFPPQTPQQQEPFLAPAFEDYNPSELSPESYFAVQEAMRRAVEQQRGSEWNNNAQVSSRSANGDEFNNDLVRGPAGPQRSIPPLDRTISNAFEDALYNPQMSTSVPVAPAPRPRHYIHHENHLSPQKSQMSDLLQVANQQHASARSVSPATNVSRERSPFRPTSDYAKGDVGSSTPGSPAHRINSAAHLREQQKAESDARVLAEHQTAPADDHAAPRTISPKEVALDYSEAQDDAKMPLSNQDKRENQISTFASNTPNLSQSDVDDSTSERSQSNTVSRRQRASNFASSTAPAQSGSNFTFMPPSGPHNTQIPQEYPFISQFRRQSSSRHSMSDQVPDFPAQLSSMDSSKSETTQSGNMIRPDFPSSAESTQRSPPSPGLQRPSDTTAASGSYTCVSPGCSARFDTSAKLQKHRRDSHQPTSPRPTVVAPTTSSSTPSNVPQSGSSAPANRNQQPGPHKCERINPSTGKPCNTVFSRSYDLTRHEDTIHSNRKQKVRCHLCTEEKTFSRNDALTRHMRVVHPDVDFPGKSKRRGG